MTRLARDDGVREVAGSDDDVAGCPVDQIDQLRADLRRSVVVVGAQPPCAACARALGQHRDLRPGHREQRSARLAEVGRTEMAGGVAGDGVGDVAAEVQRLWVQGDKAAAAAAVPEELVLAAYMIGTEDMVRERIRAAAAAGVNGLRLSPVGATAAERISHLEMAMELVAGATA